MSGKIKRLDSYKYSTIYKFDVADRKLPRSESSDNTSNIHRTPTKATISDNISLATTENTYVDYDLINCEFEENSIISKKDVENQVRSAERLSLKKFHDRSPSSPSGILSTHTIFRAIEESCKKCIISKDRSRSAKRTRDESISSPSVSCSSESTYDYFNYKRFRSDNSHIHTKNDTERKFTDLPLEWWERSERCKEAKSKHVAKIDWLCESREQLVLLTTLWKQDTVLEPNMFPYDTPLGIEHYTLWSKYDMTHEEIVRFVDAWLLQHFPQVKRWQYDDNSGERSFLLFHVHVFIEVNPYTFAPRRGKEYLPPHCASNYR